jgi:hypothetical protein
LAHVGVQDAEASAGARDRGADAIRRFEGMPAPGALERLRQVTGTAAREPDQPGRGNDLGVLLDIGLGLVANADRHRFDAELAEVGDAQLLPPGHALVPLHRAGCGDEYHWLAIDYVE